MKRSPTSTTNTYDRYEVAPRRSLYHHHTGELYMTLDLHILSETARRMGEPCNQGEQRGKRIVIRNCSRTTLNKVCTEIEAHL